MEQEPVKYIDLIWLLDSVLKIVDAKTVVENKQQISLILQQIAENMGTIQTTPEGLNAFGVVMQKVNAMGGFQKAAENLTILVDKGYFNEVT
jgi:hypothetical protein